jgi:16S rRNA (adenine1518-N6/adenine1519-N6)-dimethyltransferase
MVFAKKKWGQNFLVDNNLLEKIIKTIDIKKDDEILEIGPGHGALSEKIIQKTKSLKMVEIDPELIQVISQNPLLSPFEIFNQDILKTNLQELGLNNPKVIGNIPYNITSPIIFWLIDHLPYWSESYLMVQKEVAQRLIADIGTKDYSRITVMTGLYFNIKICFYISPNVFNPKPKVESKKYSQVVRMAFNQRRKMLRNSLSALDINRDKCQVDFQRRPEQLTIDEFLDISNNIIS